MDFYKGTCQELINSARFGLCDDENGTKAYTNVDDPPRWICTVENQDQLTITFTAIDNCVLLSAEAPGRKRCDGMITTDKHLLFIELKDRKRLSQDEMIKQLGSTIKLFKENHPGEAEKYQIRKAYGCNKKHLPFVVIDNELQNQFRRDYGFFIDIQATIIIV